MRSANICGLSSPQLPDNTMAQPFLLCLEMDFFFKKKIEGHNLVLNVRRVDFRVKWGRNMRNAFVTLHEQFDRRILDSFVNQTG